MHSQEVVFFSAKFFSHVHVARILCRSKVQWLNIFVELEIPRLFCKLEVSTLPPNFFALHCGIFH